MVAGYISKGLVLILELLAKDTTEQKRVWNWSLKKYYAKDSENWTSPENVTLRLCDRLDSSKPPRLENCLWPLLTLNWYGWFGDEPKKESKFYHQVLRRPHKCKTPRGLDGNGCEMYIKLKAPVQRVHVTYANLWPSWHRFRCGCLTWLLRPTPQVHIYSIWPNRRFSQWWRQQQGKRHLKTNICAVVTILRLSHLVGILQCWRSTLKLDWCARQYRD